MHSPNRLRQGYGESRRSASREGGRAGLRVQLRLQLQRFVEADADDRALFERDVLAFGRRDYAAGADCGTDDSAFQAADDPADDRADSTTGAYGFRFVLDPAAFEDLRRHRAHWIVAAART